MARGLSDEQIIFIKEKFVNHTAPEISKMFEEKFGFQVTDKTIYNNADNKVDYKHWHSWELKYIKENYTEDNVSGIANFLNRSESAVIARYRTLKRKEGLGKDKEIKTRYEQFEEIKLGVGDKKEFIIYGIEKHKRVRSYIATVISEYDNHFTVVDDNGVKYGITKANLLCGHVKTKGVTYGSN